MSSIIFFSLQLFIWPFMAKDLKIEKRKKDLDEKTDVC
jgi:hypothetical protein